MQSLNGHLVVSATDLVGFLGCEHQTVLDQAVAEERRPKPEYRDDPQLELLQRRGREHEARCLQRLRNEGHWIREISPPGSSIASIEQAEAETLAAMSEGLGVIYQGTLFGGRWRGHPDFLIRVDKPSAFGPWSYEPADAKLAKRVEATALLQLCVYADRLQALQEVAPDRVHVVIGDGTLHAHRLADYGAYYREVKRRFEERVFGERKPADTYPDPVEHCNICRWWLDCTALRRDDDHLCRVASISRLQTKRLVAAEVPTLTALATLPSGERKKDLVPRTLDRLREQARLQQEQYRDGAVRYELIPPDKDEPGRGLAALPEPSAGDLFLDFESDPWAIEDGLEFLIGTVTEASEAPAYTPTWAHTREEEKRAFEQLIDTIMQRLEADPGAHVYHYGAYEATAIRRLMGRYATRQEEVDRLLRGGVLVDLYRVVQQGVRVSQESYSLKKVEKLYMPEREGPTTRPGFALVEYEKWLENQDPAILDGLAAYNKDDCVSIWKMRTWLEGLRKEAEAAFGVTLGRPQPESGKPPEELAAQIEASRIQVEALTKDVPADVAERSDEQQARWLLAQLIDWHRREAKPSWWLHFTLMAASTDELVASSDAIGALTFEGEVGTVKKSILYRYRYDPEQEHKFHEGDKPLDPATGKAAGTVHAVDTGNGTIDLLRGKGNKAPHPKALIPEKPIGMAVLRDALRRVADAVLANGMAGQGAYKAARDLLLHRPPSLRGIAPGETMARPGEDAEAAAKRLALALDDTCLAIQGPPGSGKTYVGARMIVELVRAGKRVGICATSHKAITNLVDEVCEAAAQAKVTIPIVQKCDDDGGSSRSEVVHAESNEDVEAGLAEGVYSVAAGTPWLFAREEMSATLDVLFVDEAGQMSLANTVAISGAARSLVLLGDPNQLPQVSQGTHPDGADASALEHVLGGRQTLPADQGLFLETTWRLHPKVCDYISEVFYEGRLLPEASNARQTIGGDSPLSGAGLRHAAVLHTQNAARAPEEAQLVARAVELVLGKPWTDAKGRTRAIRLNDVLVVAPYNAQVGEISRLLRAQFGDAARVGTVDKFQGQEGAVVLYSMTTSSPEDAPRGMGFLYSGNRFNVAISRARALAVLVCSPDLLKIRCRSPEEMRLANALCRFVELSAARREATPCQDETVVASHSGETRDD
jgi:predicted RecB family nuclease